MTAMTARTLGVEEEILLVDAGTLRPAAPAHPELARLATWRASRSGLSGVLVDVASRRHGRIEDVVRLLADRTVPLAAEAV
jgi:gamma-glutamyl:cysteine ligase YbdK (ATP-grasp superfamily)